MSQKLNSAIAVIGVDIGKNSFHLVGLDERGAIVMRSANSCAKPGSISVSIMTVMCAVVFASRRTFRRASSPPPNTVT